MLDINEYIDVGYSGLRFQNMDLFAVSIFYSCLAEELDRIFI